MSSTAVITWALIGAATLYLAYARQYALFLVLVAFTGWSVDQGRLTVPGRHAAAVEAEAATRGILSEQQMHHVACERRAVIAVGRQDDHAMDHVGQECPDVFVADSHAGD